MKLEKWDYIRLNPAGIALSACGHFSIQIDRGFTIEVRLMILRLGMRLNIDNCRFYKNVFNVMLRIFSSRLISTSTHFKTFPTLTYSKQ